MTDAPVTDDREQNTKTQELSADATGPESAPLARTDQVSATQRVRWARRGYVLFAGGFVVCVAIQVFIAGMAVFVNPARWSTHLSFVHVFEFIPFIMVALALVGQLPRDLKLLPVGLWVLIAIQYITGETLGFGSIIAALHPVNALLIFWLGVVTTKRAWARLGAERIPS